MDKLLIEGGRVLSGEVAISGAKNAALPILCASLLSADPLHLTNVPHLNDISTMLRLLGDMGVGVTMDGIDGMVLNGGGLNNAVASYEMVKTMRASILVLGPLVARCGEARVSLPGAVPLALVRLISTSKACRRWGPTSRSNRDMFMPRQLV